MNRNNEPRVKPGALVEDGRVLEANGAAHRHPQGSSDRTLSDRHPTVPVTVAVAVAVVELQEVSFEVSQPFTGAWPRLAWPGEQDGLLAFASASWLVVMNQMVTPERIGEKR